MQIRAMKIAELLYTMTPALADCDLAPSYNKEGRDILWDVDVFSTGQGWSHS
jgi:hypothetical protein